VDEIACRLGWAPCGGRDAWHYRRVSAVGGGPSARPAVPCWSDRPGDGLGPPPWADGRGRPGMWTSPRSPSRCSGAFVTEGTAQTPQGGWRSPSSSPSWP